MERFSGSLTGGLTYRAPRAFVSKAGLSTGLSKPLQALVALLIIACLALIPNQAFANYLNTSINSTVSIQTNGSMRLVEQRTISFDEKYSAVSMRFTGLPSDAEIDVMSVRLVHVNDDGVEGEWVTLSDGSFQSGWREAFGSKSALTAKQADAVIEEASQESANSLTRQADSWVLDERDSALYIFYPFEGRMLVEVDVAIANVVFVYDDIAEFYWDYISPNNSAETNDVTVSIQLPVPEGVLIDPGKNVLAWGHGPKGVVNITSAGTIEYSVSEVLKGQYAQAHVLFPQFWLTNLPHEMEIAYSGTRRDAAIASEEAWMDTWSNSRINTLSMDLVILSLCFLAIVAAVVLYVLFGREKRPGDDPCNSDLFAVDPSIIGRLMRWNRVSTDDFVASIMRLSAAGVIQVDHADSDRECLNSAYGDLVVRTKPEGKSEIVSRMDKETMRVLFGTFADGYQKISIGEILDIAKDKPELFEDAMDGWQRELSDEVATLGLFNDRSKRISIAMLVACLVFAVLAMICAIKGWLLIAAAFAASFICLGAIGNYMTSRSALGITLSDRMNLVSTATAQSESIDGSAIEPYVAYLFAADKAGGIFEKIKDPTEVEKVWLAPVFGRGGKILDVSARYVADRFDEAYLEACD